MEEVKIQYPFYDDRERYRNVREMLDMAEQKHADHPAICWKDGKTEKMRTYRQFLRDVHQFSRWLHHSGLDGQHIALLGKTSYGWLVAYCGILCSNSVAVPLDKELPGPELEMLIRKADVACLVFDPVFSAFAETLPDIKQLSLGALAEVTEQSYPDYIPMTEPEDLAEIVFTSGTTGGSKGVMLSHKNIAVNVMDANSCISLCEQDRILSVLPVHHTFELAAGILNSLYFGMCIYINDSLRHVSQNLLWARPTLLVVVPLFVETFYKQIMRTVRAQGKERTLRRGIKISNFLLKFHIDLRKRLFREIHASFGGCLKNIVSGGAALSPDLITFFNAIGINIMQGYGITECGPILSVNPDRCSKTGSVGPSMPYAKVEIRDGEVLAGGDVVMLGYYKDPEVTDAAIRNGWFHTGDLGRLDEDGFLYLTGRKKNLIILSNGENISPEELEDRLTALECIEEAVVFGRKDTLVAAIYPNPEAFEGKAADEIEAAIQAEIQRLNQTLPPYKRIQKVYLSEKPFEKTTTKKIKRQTVIGAYQDER